MEDQYELSSFDESLARWRDSCLFYFKFDLAMIAAAAAIVSFFKLEGTALLKEAAEFRPVLQFLAWMLVYALFFELQITSVRNSTDLPVLIADVKKRTRILRVFSWGYTLQVLLHSLFVVGLLAYTSGYVDGFMSH